MNTKPVLEGSVLADRVAMITLTDDREVDDTAFLPAETLANLVAFVLVHEEVPAMGVSITLVDEAEMHTLNLNYMDKDRPTDVLAFPLETPAEANEDPDHYHLLGDVVLSPAYIARQAAEQGKTVAEEAMMLTVHGTLHLLGYDHAEPEEEKVMFGLTDALLAAWTEAQS